MKPTSHHSFLATLGLSLLVAAPLVAAKEWGALLEASPFGPQRATPSAATPAKPEFRGFVWDKGELLVSLFDPQSGISQWITVPGEVPGLEVKSYDPIAQSVVIIQAGRGTTLRLKQAHVSPLEPVGAPLDEKTSAAVDDTGKDAARVIPAAIRDLPPDIRSLAEEYLRRQRTRDSVSGVQTIRAGKP